MLTIGGTATSTSNLKFLSLSKLSGMDAQIVKCIPSLAPTLNLNFHPS